MIIIYFWRGRKESKSPRCLPRSRKGLMVCGFSLAPHSFDRIYRTSDIFGQSGGGRNRTLIPGFGDQCSTTELHPPYFKFSYWAIPLFLIIVIEKRSKQIINRNVIISKNNRFLVFRKLLRFIFRDQKTYFIHIIVFSV